MCIQDVSFNSLFQLFETFSIGINVKSLILCPGELKCSETFVIISGKCTMSDLCLFMRLAHFWWVCRSTSFYSLPYMQILIRILQENFQGAAQKHPLLFSRVKIHFPVLLSRTSTFLSLYSGQIMFPVYI